MPDTSRYLQRVSFLLRQGTPAADVALYAPTDDAWSHDQAGERPHPESLERASAIRRPAVPAILDAGHTFDLIDDGTLTEAQARGTG